jgi:hypothetical protein
MPGKRFSMAFLSGAVQNICVYYITCGIFCEATIQWPQIAKRQGEPFAQAKTDSQTQSG